MSDAAWCSRVSGKSARWSGLPRALETLHTPPASASPRVRQHARPRCMLLLVFWLSRAFGILPYKYEASEGRLQLSRSSVAYSVLAMAFLFTQWSFMAEEIHTYYVREGNILSGLEPIVLTLLNCSLMLLALLRSPHLRIVSAILTSLDTELTPRGPGPSTWLCALPGVLGLTACTADITTSLVDLAPLTDTLMYSPYYCGVMGAVLVETQFTAACFALRYWFWVLNERLISLRRRAAGASLRLEALRLTHSRLHLAATQLEAAFGPQLLLATGLCFTGTVLNAYFGVNGFYDQGLEGDASFTMQNMQWLWALLYLCRVGVTCFAATRLALEAARTARLLLTLNDARLSNGMKEEIAMFHMQLSAAKIEFTAWGIFPIDFSLLFAIVSTTTTYLLILIQYRPK